MIRYTPDQLTCDYDGFADVLYVTFSRAASVVCNETPQGYILRRSQPGNAIIGVTILDYLATFGETPGEIEIDAPTPFMIELGSVDCEFAAYG